MTLILVLIPVSINLYKHDFDIIITAVYHNVMKEKILITGGTGFIGSHTVRELLKKGYELNLLVRSIEKAESIFGRPDTLHFFQGNILDPGSMESAARGCTTIIHCAAMVSLNLKQEKEMFRINRDGTENIVSLVRKTAIKTVLYVSSCVTRFHPQSKIMTPESPLQRGLSPYAKSKSQGEELILSLKKEGINIYITSPSSVIGPDDPGLSEANNALIYLMKFGVPISHGGFQFIDVRDLAKIHCRLICGKAEPGLYLAGGHFFKWIEIHPLVQKLSSKTIPRVWIPGPVMRGMGRIVSSFQKNLGFVSHLTYEGALYMTLWNVMDDHRTLEELDFSYRRPEETLLDTTSWLATNNFIERERCLPDQTT